MADDNADKKRRAIEAFLRATGLKPFPLAKAAGVSEGTVRNFLDGRSETLTDRTYEKLAAGASKLLGRPVRAAELRGEVHLESSDVEVQAPGLREAPAPFGIERRVVTIRELDVRAAQGPNGFTLEVLRQNIDEHTKGFYAFPRDGFAQLYGAPPDDVWIIEAIGDSNAPEIMPGQRVMVNIADKRPSPPGFFALWDGLTIVLKRVEFIPHSDPPTIRISSANPAYEPYKRPIGEAHILGRVIGHWRRL